MISGLDSPQTPSWHFNGVTRNNLEQLHQNQAGQNHRYHDYDFKYKKYNNDYNSYYNYNYCDNNKYSYYTTNAEPLDSPASRSSQVLVVQNTRAPPGDHVAWWNSQCPAPGELIGLGRPSEEEEEKETNVCSSKLHL